MNANENILIMFYDSIAHTMALFDDGDDADDGGELWFAFVAVAIWTDERRPKWRYCDRFDPIVSATRFFDGASDRQSNNAINQSRGEQ